MELREKADPLLPLYAVSTFPRSRLLPKNTSRSGRGMEKWILVHGNLFTLVNWYQNTNSYLEYHARKNSETTFRVGRKE